MSLLVALAATWQPILDVFYPGWLVAPAAGDPAAVDRAFYLCPGLGVVAVLLGLVEFRKSRRLGPLIFSLVVLAVTVGAELHDAAIARGT